MSKAKPSAQVDSPDGGGVIEADALKAINSTEFLCRKKVRAFLLEKAAENRGHKFTRVSKETLTTLNANVRVWLLGIVHRAPSKGKTL